MFTQPHPSAQTRRTEVRADLVSQSRTVEPPEITLFRMEPWRSITYGKWKIVTESAINLGNTQVSGITVGIRRLGFTVVSSTPPRTGICRIAGSATCSFLLLTGHETQAYTLTLSPQAPGTYTLQGWTTQPSTGRGFGASVTVTVTS